MYEDDPCISASIGGCKLDRRCSSVEVRVRVGLERLQCPQRDMSLGSSAEINFPPETQQSIQFLAENAGFILLDELLLPPLEVLPSSVWLWRRILLAAENAATVVVTLRIPNHVA